MIIVSFEITLCFYNHRASINENRLFINRTLVFYIYYICFILEKYIFFIMSFAVDCINFALLLICSRVFHLALGIGAQYYKVQDIGSSYIIFIVRRKRSNYLANYMMYNLFCQNVNNNIFFSIFFIFIISF